MLAVRCLLITPAALAARSVWPTCVGRYDELVPALRPRQSLLQPSLSLPSRHLVSAAGQSKSRASPPAAAGSSPRKRATRRSSKAAAAAADDDDDAAAADNADADDDDAAADLVSNFLSDSAPSSAAAAEEAAAATGPAGTAAFDALRQQVQAVLLATAPRGRRVPLDLMLQLLNAVERPSQLRFALREWQRRASSAVRDPVPFAAVPAAHAAVLFSACLRAQRPQLALALMRQSSWRLPLSGPSLRFVAAGIVRHVGDAAEAARLLWQLVQLIDRRGVAGTGAQTVSQQTRGAIVVALARTAAAPASVVALAQRWDLDARRWNFVVMALSSRLTPTEGAALPDDKRAAYVEALSGAAVANRPKSKSSAAVDAAAAIAART